MQASASSLLPLSGHAAAPKLLDRVREKIRPKHYGLRTELAYTDWIRRFILHRGKRHPGEMGAAEVSRQWHPMPKSSLMTNGHSIEWCRNM